VIKEFSKGFFVASDSGHMAMWVRSDENNSTSGKQAYDFIRRWQPVSTKGIKILGLSVSPGEEYLGVQCNNNNIGLIHIKTIGLNEDITRDIKFDLVCRGFHSGSIDCIDIAVQRPLIVTCSREDSTIRLWNYFTHQCELAREYYVLEDLAIRDAAKPLKSVAMHPSGYYMAASFLDKIRIYHILHDELRQYKTLEIKNCQRMRFNQGGNFFFVCD
jgi:WD40 repeat protein